MHGPFSKILVGSPPPGSTPLLAGHWRLFILVSSFLADRTNGRAYATVLRLSFCLHVRSFFHCFQKVSSPAVLVSTLPCEI